MSSGYTFCACRDCFEIAIGDADTLCDECQSAGCEPHNGECDRPDAYGADSEDKLRDLITRPTEEWPTA